MDRGRSKDTRPAYRSVRMEIHTTRFGTLQIAEDRVINFPKGILGFPERRKFCLLQPNDEACFFWLQSLDDPALAFVVTDPSYFIADYTAPIRSDQMADLGLRKLDDAQVLVIVNKVGDELTGNLQGPLVVNAVDRVGEQLVLAEKRWTTRHKLVAIGERSRATA